jgi:DNA-binding transcriptional MerR regulator
MTQTTSENAEVRYKIGDVCRIADVQPYVLRYWESEFPLLAPDRSLPGPRTYSARELELISQIKRLLYDEGYTIAGAKKRLESEASGARSHDTNPAFIPGDLAKSESGEKPAEKSVKPPVRRPSSKAGTPVFVETAPASSQSESGDATLPSGAARSATTTGPDPRVAKAVAELKEILAILSRD